MAIRIFCDGAVGAGAVVVGIGDSSSWMDVGDYQQTGATRGAPIQEVGEHQERFLGKVVAHWDNHPPLATGQSWC